MRVLMPGGHLMLVDLFSLWLIPTLTGGRRGSANPETSLPAAQRRRLHAGGLARPLRHHHQGRDSDDLTGSDGFGGQLTTRT